MSFVSDRQLEEVRSRADVVEVVGERVSLKRSGQNFKGLCPFHNEKSPSFMVNAEKQVYRCFGCGEGGDVFSFLMKMDGIDFREAIERLADRYHVVLETNEANPSGEKRRPGEKEAMYQVNRLAAQFFYKMLQHEKGAAGREYLEKRSIRDDMIREACLGYAPGEGRGLVQYLKSKEADLEIAEKLGLIRRGQDGGHFDFFRNRLIFSVISSDKKFLGFSGRALQDDAQPKYLNSPESAVYHKSDSLLGFHIARAEIREHDQVILVEGNFDLLRLQQEGLRHAVAPLGTALTERQVRLLSRWTENFVLLFDGDAAGAKAADRSLEIFLPMGLMPRVVVLPQGEDPDTFVARQGVQALRDLISVAAPLLDIKVEALLEGAHETAGRVGAIKKIADILAKLPGEVEKRVYIQRVAERFSVPEEVLWRNLSENSSKKQRNMSNFSETSGDHKGAEIGIISYPPLEKTLLEVLVSGRVSPEVLFQEIHTEDFTHGTLGRVWKILKDDLEANGAVSLSRLLSREMDEDLRHVLAEVSFTSERWQEGLQAGQASDQWATDCVQRFRLKTKQGRLQTLSSEIRKAERAQDTELLRELLNQKNILMKEMM